MSTPSGTGTLSYLARQAARRAQTALALRISPTPTGGPVKQSQPPQPAKTKDISPDEEMLSQVREFLEKF